MFCWDKATSSRAGRTITPRLRRKAFLKRCAIVRRRTVSFFCSGAPCLTLLLWQVVSSTLCGLEAGFVVENGTVPGFGPRAVGKLRSVCLALVGVLRCWGFVLKCGGNYPKGVNPLGWPANKATGADG